MKQIAAYTYMEEGETEERFYTVLECGCAFPVPPEVLFDPDVPCVLHEPEKYGIQETP